MFLRNNRTNYARSGLATCEPLQSQPGDKSFTACGLVRRGRPLTSQTAFSGQLPYEGSLGRPAVKNVHTPNGSMWHGFANSGLRTAIHA